MNLFNAVNIHGRTGPNVVLPMNKDVTAQLQFFENFPGHLGFEVTRGSANTLLIHAVNIPLSISFNNVIILGKAETMGSALGTRSMGASFGLYSLNGSTLSLANSAGMSTTNYSIDVSSVIWRSMITSATQNITPGAWYFGFFFSGINNLVSQLFNNSINPANAIPGGFLMGRMTDSITAMPGSIATSNLDITGSDAIRQPFIIITA